MLLKSNAEFSMIDSRGKYTRVRSIDYDYFDAGVPVSGAVSWIAHDERYELWGDAQTALTLRLSGAAGKRVEFSIEAANASSTVNLNSQAIPPAASLYAMRESTSSARFYDAVAKRLYVRVVVPANATTEQIVSLSGNFPARNQPATGLKPVTVPANLVDGFVRTRHTENAPYALRYDEPVMQSSSTVSSSAALINANASDAALANTAMGQTNVLRFYVNAPSDGLYRMHVWGDGGGTSLYVNGRYVQGESYSFYNGNFFTNNVPNSEVVDYLHPSDLVSLKAGWHQVTIVHAKTPGSRLETSLMMRWATPLAPDTWVFPTVKRMP
jgi:hypothetical protein